MAESYHIDALTDAISVLEVLMAHFEALSISELSVRCGFTINKVYRIIRTYESAGWVEKIEIDKKPLYRLGFRLLTLLPRAHRIIQEEHHAR